MGNGGDNGLAWSSSWDGNSTSVGSEVTVLPVISSPSFRVPTNKDGRPKAVRELQLTHARPRSSSTSASPPTAFGANHIRTRAASTSDYRFRGPRIRVSSLSTMSTGIVPKADAVVPTATDVDDMLGSFAPTSCPRQHIKSLISSRPKPLLPQLLSLKSSPVLFPKRQLAPEESPSPPYSPLPAICRTPSSYSESEYFPSLPSSAGPLTPVHSTTPLPTLKKKEVLYALVALEEQSRFRVRTSCSTCHRAGSNYPCCPKCGEMWCSRQCRLTSTGGKKHRCIVSTG